MKTCLYFWWRYRKSMWVLIFWIVAFSACQKEPLPDHLIGVWHSDHNRYNDCSLEITAVHVIFGTPDNKMDIFSIQKVSTKDANDYQMVTIESVSEQDVRLISQLCYSADDDGRLWFKNNPEVKWYRR